MVNLDGPELSNGLALVKHLVILSSCVLALSACAPSPEPQPTETIEESRLYTLQVLPAAETVQWSDYSTNCV